MASQFSEEIVAYLREEKRLTADLIETYSTTYIAEIEKIPGLPPVAQATVGDIIAFEARSVRLATETWEEFKVRALAEHQIDQDQNDIFQPVWISKTDDRPCPWIADTANMPAGSTTVTIPGNVKAALAKVIRQSSPTMQSQTESRLTAPTSDARVMRDVLDGMCNAIGLFLWQLGTGDNLTWRWGPCLAMFGGLGLDAVRYIASHLESNEGWGHFAGLPDAELAEEIATARNVSGYPVGLYRCDFTSLNSVISGLGTAPRWYEAVVALHIIKHCRIVYDYADGFNAIMVAYKSRHAMVSYQVAGHDQPIGASINKSLQATLKSILRIPTNPPNAQTTFDFAIATVFNTLTPAMLVARHTTRARPDLIVPKAVKLTQDPDLTRGYEFINTGMVVRNCARIDVTTGLVEHNASVSGADVLTFEWPRGSMTKEELAQWQFNLPERITPMRASDVVCTMLKNINMLGEEKAFKAFLDAELAIGLVRDQLAGTPIGSAIRDEYPLNFVYPTGSTMDTTTNQGKTNLCRILVRILVPDFPSPRNTNRSDSAPVQRTLAYDIGKYGTAIFDEFVLPYSSSHMLSKESLQNLSTGGIASPGEALGNSPGIKLKYPLFFTAKVSALPPDLRNRQFAIFLDQISDKTRLPDDLLTMITSGQVSMLARLGMLMYLHKHKIVERLREAKPIGGAWRFSGHMAAAAMFADGDVDSLKRYLRKSEDQCNAQREAADETGLTDELGVNAQFSLEYYWENAQDLTLDSLAVNSSLMERSGSGLSLLDLVKYLVEDGNRRHFEAVMKQYHIREPAAVAKAAEELRKGPMTRHGWSLRLVPPDETTLKDKYGRKKHQCRLEKVKTDDKVESKTTTTPVK